MTLDSRKKQALVYIGEGPTLGKHIIEDGDEAILYHEGNLVMATITADIEGQFNGSITRSAYDPDLHPSLTTGKDISFLEENVFGVVKKKLQV